jgi:hypothetical protein
VIDAGSARVPEDAETRGQLVFDGRAKVKLNDNPPRT